MPRLPPSRLARAALCAALIVAPAAARAVDSLGFELGHGEDDVTLARLAATWKWQWRLEAPEARWHLGGYWEISAGGWRGHARDAYDAGITPVFRFQRSAGGPYVEAAIGLRVVSDLHVTSDRWFSTKFQFGDHLGIGYTFGARLEHDLGLRLQHLSNGGIRDPNPGINFVMLRYQYSAP